MREFNRKITCIEEFRLPVTGDMLLKETICMGLYGWHSLNLTWLGGRHGFCPPAMARLC